MSGGLNAFTDQIVALYPAVVKTITLFSSHERYLHAIYAMRQSYQINIIWWTKKGFLSQTVRANREKLTPNGIYLLAYAFPIFWECLESTLTR